MAGKFNVKSLHFTTDLSLWTISLWVRDVYNFCTSTLCSSVNFRKEKRVENGFRVLSVWWPWTQWREKNSYDLGMRKTSGRITAVDGGGKGDCLDGADCGRHPKTVGEINLEQQYTSTAPHHPRLIRRTTYFLFHFFTSHRGRVIYAHIFVCSAHWHGTPRGFFGRPHLIPISLATEYKKIHVLRNNNNIIYITRWNMRLHLSGKPRKWEATVTSGTLEIGMI